MEMLVWNSLIFATKLGFYLGFATLVGSTLLTHVFPISNHGHTESKTLGNLDRVITLGGTTIFLSVVLGFLANTGAMAEQGISGAFEPFMMEVMWMSSIGEASVIRLFTTATLLTSIYMQKKVTSQTWIINTFRTVTILCFFALAYTFTLTGHIAEFDLIAKLLLVLHVMIMAWWFGSLLPLRSLCTRLAYQELFKVMEKFGQLASIFVPMLLLAGLILAYRLTGSLTALVNTSYGQVLLLKVLSVVAILGLAALHKYQLVPQLKLNQGRRMLKASLTLEIAVALIILSITTGLTSFVGPSN